MGAFNRRRFRAAFAAAAMPPLARALAGRGAPYGVAEMPARVPQAPRTAGHPAAAFVGPGANVICRP